MTVAEYAKNKGVSKQSVYDKLRRGTLSYEVKEGIKHIVESIEPTVTPSGSPAASKKLDKALKRLNKVKHKLEIAVNEVKYLNTLIASKDNEIETLRNASGLLYAAINKNLLSAPTENDVIEIVEKPKKKRKKKNKK